MFLEKIEIIIGVKLNALPLRHVLRPGIDPLFSVLEKIAAIHELRLLRVLRDPLRLSTSCWRCRRESARRFGCPRGIEAPACSGVFEEILASARFATRRRPPSCP